MRKGLVLILVIIVVLLAAAGIGYVYRHPILEWVTGEQAKAFKEARSQIDANKPQDAINALRPYNYLLTEHTAAATQWRGLALDAAVLAKDGAIVVAIYEQNPHVIN